MAKRKTKQTGSALSLQTERIFIRGLRRLIDNVNKCIPDYINLRVVDKVPPRLPKDPIEVHYRDAFYTFHFGSKCGTCEVVEYSTKTSGWEKRLECSFFAGVIHFLRELERFCLSEEDEISVRQEEEMRRKRFRVAYRLFVTHTNLQRKIYAERRRKKFAEAA